MDLISRIYDPQNGDIFIGDKNIKSIEISELRSLISYVPQNNFLFSETIKKNIEFGNPNSSIDDITNAAKLAEIDLEIEEFENGYNTILGERGVTLSGGQAQRISIARSFIKDAEIYLFDDCFSSLDSDTEIKILDNLKNTFTNKTLKKMADDIPEITKNILPDQELDCVAYGCTSGTIASGCLLYTSDAADE